MTLLVYSNNTNNHCALHVYKISPLPQVKDVTTVSKEDMEVKQRPSSERKPRPQRRLYLGWSV